MKPMHVGGSETEVAKILDLRIGFRTSNATSGKSIFASPSQRRMVADSLIDMRYETWASFATLALRAFSYLPNHSARTVSLEQVVRVNAHLMRSLSNASGEAMGENGGLAAKRHMSLRTTHYQQWIFHVHRVYSLDGQQPTNNLCHQDLPCGPLASSSPASFRKLQSGHRSGLLKVPETFAAPSS